MHKLYFISQIFCVLSNKYRSAKSKFGVGCRNVFCFPITEITYLVQSLFRDLVQPPPNGIFDSKSIANIDMPWSGNMVNGAIPFTKYLVSDHLLGPDNPLSRKNFPQ